MQLLLLGSNEPIAFDPGVWLERLRAGKRYLGAPRSDELSHVLRRLKAVSGDEDLSEDLNHDLFPRDEFITPRETGPLARLLAGLEG